jgi:hypothetical protein
MAGLVLTREQKEVWDSMPKAWQQEAKKASDIQSNIVNTGILGRYDLGDIVARFTKNEANYGEEAVPNLALILGEEANALWQYRQFVGTYTRGQVEALMERARKANYRLTWSHFDALSGLTGGKAANTRKVLEKACLVERLTVTDLRAKIQKKLGGKRSSGGRPIMKPRSIAAGIGQMNKIAEQYTNRWEGWDEVVFDGIEKAGADQIDADIVRSLEEGRKAQVDLKTSAEKAITEYDKAIERAKKVLKEKPAEPAPTPAAAKNGHANGATNGAAPGVRKKKVLKRIVKRPAGEAGAAPSVKDRVANARAARPTPA